MDWISVFGNLSFVLTAISFLMKDMIRLRLVALLSGAFGIVFNTFVAEDPLWLVIFWLTIFMLINLSMLTSTYLKNKSAKFSDDEKELFAALFPELSPFEFFQLIRAGTWQRESKEILFIKAGNNNDKVALIWQGKARIIKKGAEIAELRRGSFLGELSYVKNSVPDADVVLEPGCALLVWKHEELKRWLQSYRDAAPVLNQLLTSDLAAKL